jgi:hypothetical protein
VQVSGETIDDVAALAGVLLTVEDVTAMERYSRSSSVLAAWTWVVRTRSSNVLGARCRHWARAPSSGLGVRATHGLILA